MRVAVIGSRNLFIPTFDEYLPDNTTEIVSGDANGVGIAAAVYAKDRNLKFTEFLPEYKKHGKAAPLKRNELIAEYADMIFAFWNGNSGDTKYIINHALKIGKKTVTYKAEEIPMSATTRTMNKILRHSIQSDAVLVLCDTYTNCDKAECENRSRLHKYSFQCQLDRKVLR